MGEYLNRSRDDLVAQLAGVGFANTGVAEAIKAALDGKLADEVGIRIVRLADAISASSDKSAQSAKWVADSVDRFRDDTGKTSETLRQSLEAFRGSMNVSSQRMARLTYWLVFLTAAYVITTLVQVFVIILQRS